MLKPITNNPSTKTIATLAKENKINPELLMALRKQRLEERLEAIEPCLFKYTRLLTKKYYPLGNKDAAEDKSLDAHNNLNIPLSIKVKDIKI